jgi:hypothetical protein
MFLSLTRTLRLRLRVTDSFRQHLAELVLGLCGFSLRRPFGHGKHIGTAALELKSGPAPPSPGIADATALNDARRRDRSGSAPRGRGRLFRGIVTSRRQPSSMTWRADFAAAGALRLWPSRYHACYEIDLETHLTGAAACPRRVQGKDMGGSHPDLADHRAGAVVSSARLGTYSAPTISDGLAEGDCQGKRVHSPRPASGQKRPSGRPAADFRLAPKAAYRRPSPEGPRRAQQVIASSHR